MQDVPYISWTCKHAQIVLICFQCVTLTWPVQAVERAGLWCRVRSVRFVRWPGCVLTADWICRVACDPLIGVAAGLFDCHVSWPRSWFGKNCIFNYIAICAMLDKTSDRQSIGCPWIIRTYDFTRISSLWCNRRSSSFQTFLKYTSRVIDECCIVPRSCRGLIPSPVRLAWVSNFSCFAQTLYGQLLTRSTALPSTAWLLTWHLMDTL